MNAIEAVTPIELSKAAALFGTMKQLRIQLKSADENTLDRAFEQHVQSVLEKLDQRLPALKLQNQQQNLDDHQSKQLLAVEVIMARHGLFDAAFQQVAMLCQTIAPAFGESVRELRATHSSLLTELQHCFCEVANDNMHLSSQVGALQQQEGQMENEIQALQQTLQALNNENEDYKKRVLELRKNLREATQQINYLKEAVTTDHKTVAQAAMASSNNALNGALSNTLASFNSAYMSSTLNFEDPAAMSLEQQLVLGGDSALAGGAGGGQLTRKRSNSANPTPAGRSPDALNNNSGSFRLRRSGSSGNLNNSSSRNLNASANNLSGEWNASVKDSAIKDPWGDEVSVANSMVSASPSRTNRNTTGLSAVQKGGLSIVAPVNWLLIFRAEVQKALDEGRCREMTLKEVTETIQKLYQSKVIANEKAGRGIGNVPLETMEQHVFRTYEHKYGLRSIAVEHAGALLRSLLLHSAADNEVMVFLKIFRNELEEEFRFIQAELFSSIKDLTMAQIHSRFPNKDQAGLNALLEQKLTSGTIYEDDWNDLTNYLYNAADATTLGVLLKKLGAAEKAKITYFDSPGGVNKTPLSANSNVKVAKPNTAYVLESGSPTGAAIGYDKRNNKDVKRLGYASPTLQIALKDNTSEKRKDMLKLPFPVFLRTVLDFQLQSHLQYLQNFVRVFRQMDKDVDGVINAAEFKECFLLIRRGVGTAGAASAANADSATAKTLKSARSEQSLVRSSGGGNELQAEITEAEMSMFLDLIVTIDPMQTDRVTFSSAVTCLSKMKP